VLEVDLMNWSGTDFAFCRYVNALTELERKVGLLQRQLIWFRGSIEHVISHSSIREYAGQLASRYYPIRANNAAYLEAPVHAFCYDLVLAPAVHRYHHLWRYNYDDLDILAQFYRFSTPRQRYYYVAHGTLGPPTVALFNGGCSILGVDAGDTEELFSGYYLEGARARVPARVIESIAGLPWDIQLNQHYGFLEMESQRRLRKLRGQGRFRFLRRGRTWMALGTHAAEGTTDLRERPISDLFGYQIWIEQDEIRASVSRSAVELVQAELLAIIESESRSYYRLHKANEFYLSFCHQRRFANAVNWYRLDEFLARRVRRMVRSGPKLEYSLVRAADNRPEIVTYLPRRSNFFWNLGEVNCPYHALWNPYRWPQPDGLRQIIACSKEGADSMPKKSLVKPFREKHTEHTCRVCGERHCEARCMCVALVLEVLASPEVIESAAVWPSWTIVRLLTVPIDSSK
jgi:hypothetical protein